MKDKNRILVIIYTQLPAIARQTNNSSQKNNS